MRRNPLGPKLRSGQWCPTEAGLLMKHTEEAIIFFDKLGFGWVIDRSVLKHVKLSVLAGEELPSRSLIEMIENILSEKPVM
jgi:hypothetical protein